MQAEALLLVITLFSWLLIQTYQESTVSMALESSSIHFSAQKRVSEILSLTRGSARIWGLLFLIVINCLSFPRSGTPYLLFREAERHIISLSLNFFISKKLDKNMNPTSLLS